MRILERTIGAATLVALIPVTACTRHVERSALPPSPDDAASTAPQSPPARPSGVSVAETSEDDEVVIPDAHTEKEPTAPNPTESEVVKGMGWLSRQQDATGGWHDPATTGMVLLSFLGGGQTHQSGSQRDTIRKAQTWLIAGQDADGCLVPRTLPRLLRDHAVAGLALCEAYGMTGSRALKEPSQKAVAFALKSRTPGGGWNLPAPDGAELDVETTAWMSLLLKSADMSELDVDKGTFPEVLAALDRVTAVETGRVQATSRARGSLSEDAATAVGFTLRLLLDTKPVDRRSTSAVEWLAERPLAQKAADWLVTHPPAPETDDLQYVYFGSVGMISLGGQPFRAWLPALNAVVARPSVADGPDKGSWDPPAGGTVVDRIWTTVYRLRCLEFHHGPVGHASMRR